MLLDVRDLTVEFHTRKGVSTPVDRVSYSVDRGESLGLVGESGSGKSMSSLSLLRLVPPPGRITDGAVLLDGQNLLELPEEEMRLVRGRAISMILQDPLTSLNPVFSIGNQVGEAVALHQRAPGRSLMAKVVELLEMARIPSPASRVFDYPHQLSGGMRQRVAGAIALASDDLKVLIADEPTTALDVTVQAQYLELLRELQAKVGFGLILISHDLGVVASMCHRIAIMYAGRIVEIGPTRQVIDRPRHFYTRALLACLPRLGPGPRLQAIAGEPPDPLAFPSGCRFAPRCRRATDQCRAQYPDVMNFGEGHAAACWYGHEQS